jgi:hypothetical protein
MSLIAIVATANKDIGIPLVGGVLMRRSCPFRRVAVLSQTTSNFVERHHHITI